VHVGGVIIDQPYGLGREEWDKAWTAEEVLTMFKQIDACTKKETYWVAMYCNHHLLLQTMTCMEKHGFSNVSYLVWWKNNFNIDHAPHLVFATEFVVVGWRSGTKGTPSFLESNPTKRHNVIIGHQQRNFHMNNKGQVVNPYQKPVYLAYSICKAFTEPTSTIVVVGFGAGGDIEGAVAAGMSVVAFEKDKNQYEAVVGIWRAYQTKVESSSVENLFPGVKLGRLGSSLTDVSVAPQFVEKVQEYADQLLEQEEESKRPSPEVKCVGCDTVVGTEDMEIPKCPCGSPVCDSCSASVFESLGIEKPADKRFCSKICQTAHS
jgi:hypothetical protein